MEPKCAPGPSLVACKVECVSEVSSEARRYLSVLAALDFDSLACCQVDAADIFVLRDDEDLEDVLRRVADQRRYGCVLVNNTRMDEPAQVRRGGREAPRGQACGSLGVCSSTTR